jgi:drug/metabolite transporter (DMT)-like permease
VCPRRLKPVKRSSFPAWLAAGGTVVLWAAAFPAITVAVAGLGPVGLSVARLCVASVALAAAAPFLRIRWPRPRDLPLIALCGLAGMTAYQLLLNYGERVVPPGTASLLVATAPVFASLFAAGFLGERPQRRRWAGSALALGGTAVIAASHGLAFGAASLVVLAAAVVQATFHTAEKPLLARYTGFEVTAYAMWAGTVFLLPWSGTAARAIAHAVTHGGGGAIAAAVFLGLGPSALGFALWAFALARMDVGRATLALYLVPAVAIVVSLVWLSQAPSLLVLGGGGLAVCGVAFAQRAPAHQRGANQDHYPERNQPALPRSPAADQVSRSALAGRPGARAAGGGPPRGNGRDDWGGRLLRCRGRIRIRGGCASSGGIARPLR